MNKIKPVGIDCNSKLDHISSYCPEVRILIQRIKYKIHCNRHKGIEPKIDKATQTGIKKLDELEDMKVLEAYFYN